MRIIIKTKATLRYGTKMDDGWHIDTDQLTNADRVALDRWCKAYPDAVRPDPTPAPAATEPEQEHRRRPPVKPDVIERKAPDAPYVDPIQQILNDSIRQQIEQQQMDARFLEYQVVQGLVDNSHNAALLKDWIQRYGTGFSAVQNVDRAIRALRPQLHFKELSAFTKRLAGF